MKLVERVRGLGFEKERAAVAALALSFFAILYFFVGLNAPPGWTAAFCGLALLYATAFLALASQWFWARWFASGLGWSGTMVAIAATFMVGWNPALAIYGTLHALVTAALLGEKMAGQYELQAHWRERYQMDEHGVARLRKAVTRGAAALPSLIIWALGPREGEGSALLAPAAVVLALIGLHGLVKLRTWGVLAIGGAGVMTLVAGGRIPGAEVVGAFGAWDPSTLVAASSGISNAIALLLLAAALPFASSAIRYYRSLR